MNETIKTQKKKFILIYGSPAVGKLTVSKELEKITDYHIFHNHDVIDLVVRFWSREDIRYQKIRCELAFKAIDLLLSEGAKIIFTHSYAKNFVFKTGMTDTEFIDQIYKICKKRDYEFCPIQLICDEKEILRRIKSDSRKLHGKLKKVSIMKNLLKTSDFSSPLEHSNNFVINNTNISAKKVAKTIKENFRI